MGIEFWKKFAKCAVIRAIRTMFQTAVALMGTDAMGVTDVDWQSVVSGAVLAGLVSVFTSLATGLPEVPEPEKRQEEPETGEE